MPTEPQSFWQRRWKLILNIVTFAALLVLIVAIHKQLGQTIDNLRRVDAIALLLLLVTQALNYLAQAKTYQGLFAILGDKFGIKTLAKFCLELNFVNHVFPSGGVTGISYFGVRLKQSGMRVSKSTLVHLVKLVLIFLSFEVLLIFGLIVLAAGGHANNLVILLCGVLTTAMLFGTAGFGYMLGSKRRIDRTFTAVTKALNWLIHLVRRQKPETISIDGVKSAVDDLSENYDLFISHWRQLQAPFWWALVANITEVLTIYVVYIAFGEWVNIGAVILAYAVANFAGLVSVLPGGIGIYEGLMTVVLAAGGIPAGVSLPVTIMYRVLNTLIQLPPGYYLYHRNLRTGNRKLQHDI